MSNEDDIREYFSDSEWNALSQTQRAMFTDFAVTIDIFSPENGDMSVKQEVLQNSEFKDDVAEKKEQFDEVVGDEKCNIDIGNYTVSCKMEASDSCDVETNSEEEPELQINDTSTNCETCRKSCEDLCLQCQMVIRILNNTIENETIDAISNTLPMNILEIKKSPGGIEGIFCLKTISKDTIFGPCANLERGKKSKGIAPRIKSGKLVNVEDAEHSNWMQLVNCAKNSVDENLDVFQYENELYYRTKRQIDKSEELLVYKKNYYCPVIEKDIVPVYACTFCCLGFYSEVYLLRHRRKCPHSMKLSSSVEEIVQCSFCNIYLNKKEYSEFHRRRCSEISSRKHILSTARFNERNKERKKPEPTAKSKKRKKETRVHRRDGNYNKDILNKQIAKDYNIYRCPECSYTSNSKAKVMRHGLAHKSDSQMSLLASKASTKKESYQCKICDKRIKHKVDLKLHILGHTEKKPKKEFLCHNCDFKCNTRTSMMRHIKFLHQPSLVKKHKCLKCPFETNYLANLKKHAVVHDNRKLYECGTCHKKFNSKLYLKKHGIVHTTEMPFSCKQCDFKAKRKSAIALHVRRRHPKDTDDKTKKFNCTKCDYGTNKSDHFQQHVNMHEGIKPFKCDVCGKSFSQKPSLKTHQSIHNKEKSFACEQCDYRSHRKGDLQLHVLDKHSGKNRYSCAECDYGTNHKSNFIVHQNNRHGTANVTEYKCANCDFTTKYKDNLRTHMKCQHGDSDDKRLKCTKCDYETNFRSSLHRHVATHHGSGCKSIKCKHCSYETTYSGNMVRHVRNRHSNTRDKTKR